MASSGSISASFDSPSISTVSFQSKSRAVSSVQANAKSASVGGDTGSTKTDSTDLSRAAEFLYQVDQQIRGASSTGFRELLSGAADSVRVQADGEGDPTQVAALENLAGRLQVAADTSGLSALSPYSLISILGS